MQLFKKFTLFIILIFIATASSATNNKKQNIIKRFAIVVGANDGGYNRTKLRYAVSDANSFMSVIQEMGGVEKENSLLLFQPDRRNFFSAMRKLYWKIYNSKKNIRKTELFFYYSGHSDEEGLLLKNEKVTYKELKDSIKKIPADVRIAILDSCSSGAFTQIKGGKVKPPFLIDSSYDMKGNAFMSSSSKDEASQESDKIKGSFFTHFLVSGLRGAADVTQDSRITLNEAYQFAYNETLTRTEKTMSGPQHANYNIQMSGTGDVVLTDISKGSAKLVVTKNINGKIYIRNSNKKLISEFYKSYGRKIVLGLEYDEYKIIKTEKNNTYETSISLEENKKYYLKNNQFSRVKRETTVTRGSQATDNKTRKTLINFKNITWGGYGALVFKYSKVGETYGTFGGAKISAILNHQLMLGIAGHGLLHPTRGLTIKDNYDGQKPYIQFGYGGAMLEYLFLPDKLVSYSVGTLVGAGGFSFEDKENVSGEEERDQPNYTFFVIEPEVNIHLNFAKYVRIGVGVSYRKTNGINSGNLSDKDFSNLNASIQLSAGWF